MVALTLFLAATAAAMPFLGSSFIPVRSGGFSNITNCPLGELSCHNTTVQADTCCFESKGGLFMLVELWDVNPSTGPVDEWTIHGLWSDYCNGTWPQFCDASRQYPSIADILTNNSRPDILDFMKMYWLDQYGKDEAFWEHEWNKHGTCMTTLDTQCMPAGSKVGADATLFFQQVINLFKGLPTYKILGRQGIFPSATRSYTYDELTTAVKNEIGITPAFDCSNRTIFEISYYHNLRGSVIDGQFQQIDAFTNGSCPLTGPLWYIPKNSTDSTTTTASSTSTSTSSIPTTTSSTTTSSSTSSTAPSTITSSTTSTTETSSAASSTPTQPHGILFWINVVDRAGVAKGCLTTTGRWSSDLTACGSYTFKTTHNGEFKLKTSNGSCAINIFGEFSCGWSTWPSQFSKNASGAISYEFSSRFSADNAATASHSVAVKAGRGRENLLLTLVPQ